MTAFIFTDEKDQYFHIAKSRVLRKNDSFNDVINAAAVAKYSYGPPLANGESADTPPNGYLGCPYKNRDLAEKQGWSPKIDQKESRDDVEFVEARVNSSGMVAVVYRNKTSNQIIVGFKGSAAAESGYDRPGYTDDQRAQGRMDWRNNEQQMEAFSNVANNKDQPQQYIESAEYLKEILERFPNDRVAVSGHSKGGGQVQYAMLANMGEIERRNVNPSTAVKGYGFNPSPLARSIDYLVQHERMDRDKMRSFASRNIELFQLSNTAGMREAIAESIASQKGVNAVSPSEWYGKMNYMLSPKNAKCSDRDLHSLELVKQAAIHEHSLNDDFLYKGRKFQDWRSTQGKVFYKYEVIGDSPFEQPLPAAANCTNKSLFSESPAQLKIAEWRGRSEQPAIKVNSPKYS